MCSAKPFKPVDADFTATEIKARDQLQKKQWEE